MTRLTFILLPAALLALIASNSLSQTGKPASAPTYERDIRPLFAQACVACHTKNYLSNAAISGGLALDDFASLQTGVKLKEGKRSVLTPGKPAASELFLRLETKDEKRRMPKASDPLSKAQIAMVRKWIESGAPRGSAGKPAVKVTSAPAAAANVEVVVPTSVTAQAELLPAGAPKDTKLKYSLRAGPLPPVTSIAYSPDGKLLAIGSYRAVFLFEVPEGRVSRVLSEPAGAVQSVSWSKDGKLLAATGGVPGSSGEVILYDAGADYKPITGFAGHTDVIYSAAFDAEAKVLATASQDKTVRTWDIVNRKPGLVIRSHSDVVYRVRFSPNGKSIFSCGQDRSVRQFEAATGKVARNYDGHQNAVTALDIRQDGQVIVTSGAEPRVRWWNVADGGTPRYSDGSSVQVNDVAFSKSGKLLAAASADKGVRVWSGENGGLIKAFTDAPDWNYGVSISPDDRFVAAAGADGAVRIWEIQPGTLRATVLVSPPLGKRQAEWAVVGEQGYLAASDGWNAKVSLKAGNAALGEKAAPTLAILKKPEMIQKALKGEKVDPPVLTPAKKP